MKPILFNTEMTRAILDNRKTVTRRICKDANEYCVPLNSYIDNGTRTYAIQNYGDKNHTDYVSLCEVEMHICVGDVLYVRETWLEADDGYHYKADIKVPSESEELRKAFGYKWKPSIHMPKDAARIFLKITDVKIERLQDITLQDIEREVLYCEPPYTKEHFAYQPGMRIHWVKLWNSTIPKKDLDKYGWDANPWVTVTEFKRIERP